MGVVYSCAFQEQKKEGRMKRWRSRLGLNFVLACALSAPLALAQQQPTDDLKKDIETLKEGMKAIQKDIQEIKALLQKAQPAQPPQNVVLELGKSPFKGERTAKLTLVEFSDYQ
jgi:protein-disulfide isomerase